MPVQWNPFMNFMKGCFVSCERSYQIQTTERTKRLVDEAVVDMTICLNRNPEVEESKQKRLPYCGNFPHRSSIQSSVRSSVRQSLRPYGCHWSPVRSAVHPCVRPSACPLGRASSAIHKSIGRSVCPLFFLSSCPPLCLSPNKKSTGFVELYL